MTRALIAGIFLFGVGWTMPFNSCFAAENGSPSEASANSRVIWSGPDSCGTSAEFLERIQQENIVVPDDVRVRVQVNRVDGINEEYLLRMSVNAADFSGSRSLKRPDCATLQDAAVVLLALAIAAGEEQSNQKHTPTPAPEHSEQTRTPWHPWVSGAWSFSVAAQPSLAHGPFVALGLSNHSWSLGMGAFALLPSHLQLNESVVADEDLPRLRVFQLGVWPEACGSVNQWLGACWGVQAAFVQANGSGVQRLLSATNLWIAPSLGIPVSTNHGRWKLSLGLFASFPLLRPIYVIEPYGEVFQPGVVVGTLRAQIQWQKNSHRRTDRLPNGTP